MILNCGGNHICRKKVSSGKKDWKIYEPAVYDIAKNIQVNYNNIQCYISKNGMGIMDEEQSMLLYEGWGELRVGDDRFQVKKGDRFFIPAGVGEITWEAGTDGLVAIVCNGSEV